MVRFLLYALGGILIVAGIVAVAFQLGADEWVSNGVIWALALVLIGMLVVGLSSRAPEAPPPEDRHVEEHHYHDRHE